MGKPNRMQELVFRPVSAEIDYQARMGEAWAMIYNNNCEASNRFSATRYDWLIPAPPIKSQPEG